MLKLIIKLKGKVLQEVELKEAEEYTIGRGKDNNIVLPDQAGVSRKHLSLFQGEDNEWIVKNLSQISELSIEGEQIDEGPLPIGGAFRVKDFEFILQKNTTKSKPAETKHLALKADSPQIYKTESQVKELSDLEEEDGGLEPLESLEENLASGLEENPSSAKDLPVSSEGKTYIMDKEAQSQKLSAYLKVSCDEGALRDIFKLEMEDQSAWIFGRDEALADIIVDNANISRKHFKISLVEGLYYIQDLKSSNGTILNDKELSSGKKYLIESGDIIYILDIEITFEIKNL